jgi:hypothetical protein
VKNERARARILVVGGHSRNVGKTSLIVDLIHAFPEAAWTAVKITQHGHGVFNDTAKDHGRTSSQCTVAFHEEHDRSNHTDTSRFLVAGAARALLLRVKQGQFAEALQRLGPELDRSGTVIVESNSILQFLEVSLCLIVLDPSQQDFKSSARWALDRTDAFVLRSPLRSDAWQGVSQGLAETKPSFFQRQGDPFPPELADFVRKRFFA